MNKRNPAQISAPRTARHLMTWARDKPQPVRNLAVILIAQLRIMADCPYRAVVRATVAGTTERLAKETNLRPVARSMGAQSDDGREAALRGVELP